MHSGPEYSEQIDFDASIAMAAVDFEQTGITILFLSFFSKKRDGSVNVQF